MDESIRCSLLFDVAFDAWWLVSYFPCKVTSAPLPRQLLLHFASLPGRTFKNARKGQDGQSQGIPVSNFFFILIGSTLSLIFCTNNMVECLQGRARAN